MLAEGPLQAYLRWAIAQRRDFVIWAGARPHVVVIEPESVREMLLGDHIIRNIEPIEAIFGEGLLRLEGESWKQRRSLYAAAFRGEPLAELVGIVQSEVERLIGSWHDRAGQAFRPSRDLSACLLRILGRFLFGFDFDEQRHGGKPLHTALVTLASDSVMRHFTPLLARRNRAAVAAARRWLDDLCEEILRVGRDTPFLSALRGALARGEVDRATVIDELRTFLIAGHETSATAVAWVIALLAEHGELAEPLRREAQLAPGITTVAQVGELEITARWVKETLRLYPTVPLAVSRAASDVRLGRLEVAHGTRIDMSCYVQHRLPWHWPNPERFDPDRFSRPPSFGTYLPFSMGPHTCLGQQLAMIEVPLLVSRLASQFTFELPEGPPRPNLRVSLHPAGLTIIARPSAKLLASPRCSKRGCC
jgi:cytochrome P450